MSSQNTNINAPLGGAMGSSGRDDHVGSRDNTHDGYSGSNIFSDNRGVDTTNSESYGRSTGLNPRLSQSGMNSSSMASSQNHTEHINPTTHRQYGEPTGTGLYDPSRLNTSSSSATGGMPISGSGFQSTTQATGVNSGRGIHAEPFYHQGTGTSGIPGSTTSTTGHQTHSDHHGHSQHHQHHETDKEHCTMCHMVDERASQIGSAGHATTTKTTSSTAASGTSNANMPSNTGMSSSNTGMTSSTTQPAGLAEDATTVKREGPSYMHLKPGETVVENETRVHHGLSPSEKLGSQSESSRQSGIGSNRKASSGGGMPGNNPVSGMGSTAKGPNLAQGSSAGVAGGDTGAGSKGLSITEKLKLEAEKAASKLTGSKSTGPTAQTQN